MNDGFLEELMEDPVEFMWMYFSWIEELKDEHKFAEKYSILQGSFSNPQMARRFYEKEKNTVSSEGDLDRTMQEIEEGKFDTQKPKRRRRR